MDRNDAIQLIATEKIKLLSPEERKDILLGYWTIDEHSSEFVGLPIELKKYLQSHDEAENSADKLFDPLLKVAFKSKLKGVTNWYLKECLRQFSFNESAVNGEFEKRLFNCPCCGYKTLNELGVYNICDLCEWEDDGTKESDRYSGPNHCTLADWRKKFFESAIEADLKKWPK